MKIFSTFVILLMIALSSITAYSAEVLAHNVDYTAWVCSACGSDKKTVTLNFPPNTDAKKYKVKYYLKASGMEHAKVVIRIQKSGGQSQDIELYQNEPNNDLEILATHHPVTITSIVDCKGAGLWEKVKATVKVTQTAPYGN